jgi:riboflavin transporter FmnP
MNTKAFAMSITFAVVAMVLNPAVTGIKIPSPFLTGLYYQVWDIPIMVAFLLLGFKYGVFAGVLNSVFLFAVFPGPSQPFYAPSNVVAQFSMMIGIYLAIKLFIRRREAVQKTSSRIKLVVTSTVLGTIVRLPIMLAIMFLILHYLMGIAQSVTFALLFVQVIYILVISAYTIPVAFVVARAVNKNLKVGNLLSEDPSKISAFYLVN